MSYTRVIPRDLFNEANLLKCYGHIYLNLEKLNLPGVKLTHGDEGEPFQVFQNQSDGSLSLLNVTLYVKPSGFWERVRLHRPLNSRAEWPLYLTTQDDDEIEVFGPDGDFSPGMLAFLQEAR